jgi:hypothetical protein
MGRRHDTPQQRYIRRNIDEVKRGITRARKDGDEALARKFKILLQRLEDDLDSTGA